MRKLVVVLEAVIAGIVLFGAIRAMIVLPVEIGTLFLAFLQVVLGVNDVIMVMEDTKMKEDKMESGTHEAVRVF